MNKQDQPRYIILDLPTAIGPYRSLAAALDARLALFDEGLEGEHPILELESESTWISGEITGLAWTEERESELKRRREAFREMNPACPQRGLWW